MRVLLVSDLHYDLRKLDWLLAQAEAHDLVAVAGDLLDVASTVPLDVQITVVLEYLARLATRTVVAVCSGNHDLDTREVHGEKVTRWLAEARGSGVVVDGDSRLVGGWQVTSCAWWEGPTTLAAVQQGLAAVPASERSLWVWHGPPKGPLSWTGSRHYEDSELPALLEEHRPDVVLCGHIHQAPFAEGGAWAQQVGKTWLFNAGHQRGPVPAAVHLDLHARGAVWRSQKGEEELSLS